MPAQHAGQRRPASTIGSADPTPRLARESLFAAALLKSGCQVTAADAPTLHELARLARDVAQSHPRRQAGSFDYAGHRFALAVQRDPAGELQHQRETMADTLCLAPGAPRIKGRQTRCAAVRTHATTT